MRFVVVAAIVVSAMFASPGSVAAQEAEGAQPKQARPRPAASVRSEQSEKPREVSQAERRRPPSASAAETRSNDQQDQAAPSAQRPGAVRRPPPSSPSGSGSSGSTSSGSNASERAVPASSRTPDNVDYAVPRHSPAYPPQRDYNYPHHHHYYDPWGYGAFSLGYFYFTPWGYGPGYWGPGPWGPGYYGYGPYVPYGYDLGMVKLKVRPRDAEVYVDGYYAGTVDDFDGVFQALKLDTGGHKIEIRKPGFATLQFDVLVQPERTITYRGEMQATP